MTDIVIYKVLKLMSVEEVKGGGLTDIVIYKVLKRTLICLPLRDSLTDIVIYKVLKPQIGMSNPLTIGISSIYDI